VLLGICHRSGSKEKSWPCSLLSGFSDQGNGVGKWGETSFGVECFRAGEGILRKNGGKGKNWRSLRLKGVAGGACQISPIIAIKGSQGKGIGLCLRKAKCGPRNKRIKGGRTQMIMLRERLPARGNRCATRKGRRRFSVENVGHLESVDRKGGGWWPQSFVSRAWKTGEKKKKRQSHCFPREGFGAVVGREEGEGEGVK